MCGDGSRFQGESCFFIEVTEEGGAAAWTVEKGRESGSRKSRRGEGRISGAHRKERVTREGRQKKMEAPGNECGNGRFGFHARKRYGEGEGKVGEGSGKGIQEHARAWNNSHMAMELGGRGLRRQQNIYCCGILKGTPSRHSFENDKRAV